MMTSLFTDHVSRSLGAAKNIYPTTLFKDSTKHDTAVTIVFFNELFEVKSNGVHGINLLRVLGRIACSTRRIRNQTLHHRERVGEELSPTPFLIFAT